MEILCFCEERYGGDCPYLCQLAVVSGNDVYDQCSICELMANERKSILTRYTIPEFTRWDYTIFSYWIWTNVFANPVILSLDDLTIVIANILNQWYQYYDIEEDDSVIYSLRLSKVELYQQLTTILNDISLHRNTWKYGYVLMNNQCQLDVVYKNRVTGVILVSSSNCVITYTDEFYYNFHIHTSDFIQYSSEFGIRLSDNFISQICQLINDDELVDSDITTIDIVNEYGNSIKCSSYIVYNGTQIVTIHGFGDKETDSIESLKSNYSRIIAI